MRNTMSESIKKKGKKIQEKLRKMLTPLEFKRLIKPDAKVSMAPRGKVGGFS
jgi:hypothetical protein